MRTLAILALTILAITTSCTPCSPESTPTAVTGNWKFIAYYTDPGDGSATWQPVPAGQTYLHFWRDRSIHTDIPSLAQYVSYALKGDSLITFKSINNPPIDMRLRVQDNTLEIFPPCFEGCGFRFRKDP